jgi:prepilin-type N-terminal cleavage/methylation domain-containing protein
VTIAQGEGGYSLIELLTTMAILSVVLGGITTLFVAGSNADSDLNRRYQAQTAARLALDRIRRDGHAACGLATGYSASKVTLLAWDTSTPPVCATPTRTWCTLGSGTRYALYRLTGAVACTAGPKYADYLTSGSLFSFTTQNSPAGSYTLARLHVDFPVNLTPAKTVNAYRLVDDIAFRNSPRS